MSVWDNPGEMLARAEAARTQGDQELAYQMFARASELNPQDAVAWQGRAETSTSSDEALVSYAYASALDGSNQPLARTLDAAVAQRVADSDKQDLTLLVALGQELAEVGMTDRAQSLLQRATELDPTSTDAWVWLAGVSTDSKTQLEYLNRAIETNPRDSRARAGLLAIKPPTPTTPLKTEQEKEDVIKSTDLNAILAYAALSENPDERENLYLRALELDPDNAQARDGLSMLRVRRLRDSAHIPDSVSSSPARTTRSMPPAEPPAPATSNLLRNLLLALIAVVVLLALVGLLLQILQ